VYQFLQENKLLSLLGTLQYGYSVQGYGSTAPDSTMSAYYLFMWITPPILLASLEGQIKELVGQRLQNKQPVLYKILKPLLKEEAIVTAWTKGWGDVWRQLKLQFDQEGSGVTIRYNQNITKIIRSGVDEE
jgi:hypothetical protein